MSLLMEILNKLKVNGKKAKLHPFFLRGNNPNRNSKLKIAFLLGLLVISASGSYLLFNYLVGGGNSLIGNTSLYTGVEKAPRLRSGHSERAGLKSEQPLLAQTAEVKSASEKDKGKPADSGKESPEELTKRGIAKNLPPPPAPSTLPKSEIDTNSLLLEADLEFRKGNIGRSIRLYEKVIELQPSEIAVNNLLILYAKTRRYESAQRLLETHFSDRALYGYLIELANQGELETATALAERFINRDGGGFINFALGYILELRGDEDRAINHYRKAFELNPSNWYFGFNYARLLEKAGRDMDAYRVYKRLNNLKVEDPKVREFIVRKVAYMERLVGGE